MFSVIEKTMTSQLKKRFELCYETSINCMIYSVLLFWTETLNSYQLCEKVFASDWESQLVYSQSIILKSTINQDVERELRIYCNYMQNDWVKWISMMKFSDNFNIFLITSMILFYFNKEFHSRMSFNSDMTDYETTHERLEARKADDIVIQMKELLNFNHQ